MKLLRFGEPGTEKPGVLINNEILDVSAFGEDFGEKFFETDGIARLQEWLKKNTSLPKVKGVRIGAPFTRPSKIICVGLNYTKHALESQMDIPKEPIIFFKSTTALVGPTDDLIIPRNSVKTDWEVELAVVIDYSEREFQLERNGQWVKGKSCDTFAPMGPYLVTKDEVPNYNSLHMWLKVNGRMMQDNNTDDMIFEVPFLIHYISQFMTLLPGDVISTGTPAGVGLGFKPPIYLKVGDVIELGIEGLGEQRQVAK
jgi:2-keto-4-pentenoate hydratase/2-oxohepta-3-ene-1,7-dioic acid hydratase in catechol pathway